MTKLKNIRDASWNVVETIGEDILKDIFYYFIFLHLI
jgi:hypothetical protein